MSNNTINHNNPIIRAYLNGIKEQSAPKRSSLDSIVDEVLKEEATSTTRSLQGKARRDTPTLLGMSDEEIFMKLPPIGIEREPEVYNCWANAILQLFANSPSLLKIVSKEKTDTSKQLGNLLRPLARAVRSNYDKAYGIDGGELREMIPVKSETSMEDAGEALMHLLSNMGFEYSLLKETQHVDQNNTVVFTEKNIGKESIIRLPIMNGDNTFVNMVKAFFSKQVELDQITRLQFHTTPEDLFFQSAPHETLQHVPMYFDLDPQYIHKAKKNIPYELVSFIITRSQHCFAVIKKWDQWYKVDDDRVTKLNEDEVIDLANSAHVFHYRKTEHNLAQQIVTIEDQDFVFVENSSENAGWGVVNAASNVGNALFYAAKTTYKTAKAPLKMVYKSIKKTVK